MKLIIENEVKSIVHLSKNENSLKNQNSEKNLAKLSHDVS